MEIKARHEGEWGLPESLTFKEPVHYVDQLPSDDEIGSVRWVNKKECLYVKSGKEWEPVPQEYENERCEVVDGATSLFETAIMASEGHTSKELGFEVGTKTEPEPTEFERAMEILSGEGNGSSDN